MLTWVDYLSLLWVWWTGHLNALFKILLHNEQSRKIKNQFSVNLNDIKRVFKALFRCTCADTFSTTDPTCNFFVVGSLWTLQNKDIDHFCNEQKEKIGVGLFPLSLGTPPCNGNRQDTSNNSKGGAASVGSCAQKFGFINGVDNVNWPSYRDSKSWKTFRRSNMSTEVHVLQRR